MRLNNNNTTRYFDLRPWFSWTKAICKIAPFLLIFQIAFADSSADTTSEKRLALLNKARIKNGLHALKISQKLTKAAQGHSEFQAINGLCSHIQKQGLPGFSGETPLERALSVNYQHRSSLENVSCSRSALWADSINDLMTAIYHRFAFLGLNIDNIGYAHSEGKNTNDLNRHKFTYMMGNSTWVDLCERANATKSKILQLSEDVGSSMFWSNICLNPNIQFDDSLFKMANKQLTAHAPNIVVYPYPDQDEVFPAFLDNEYPDPTPFLKLSGIPVSVQFNSDKFTQVNINSFEIVDSQGYQVDVWRLDALNDVHNKIKDHEFAWFPVYPLQWDSEYNVTLEYVVDEQVYNKKWSFKTQAHPYKFAWPLEDRGDVIMATKGERVAVIWRNMSSEAISHIRCSNEQAQYQVEMFDTVSLVAQSEDVRCYIWSKGGLKTHFILRAI